MPKNQVQHITDEKAFNSLVVARVGKQFAQWAVGLLNKGQPADYLTVLLVASKVLQQPAVAAALGSDHLIALERLLPAYLREVHCLLIEEEIARFAASDATPGTTN